MMDRLKPDSVSTDEWCVFLIVLHGILFLILVLLWLLFSRQVAHDITLRDWAMYFTMAAAGLDAGSMICLYRKWRAGA